MSKKPKDEEKENNEDLSLSDLKREMGSLKKDLKDCQKEKEEYLNGWKRERADFLNYKKEEIEKIKKITESNTERIILKILPILDSFDLAYGKIPEKTKKEDDFIKGFFQIKSFFENFLRDEGVEEVNCLGKPFDPFSQEAVEMVDKNDKNESGVVVEVIQKGYKIKNKLLRPARVKVVK